jgi:hypothetical protein
VQTDAAAQIRSDAFIAFPPATAAAQALAGATFRALEAPAGMSPSPAARQRVLERIRLTRVQRRHQPG